MKTLHCLELIYFNPSKTFALRLFKMAANQIECSKIEQTSVVKFWWVSSVHHEKFPKE